ncbi:hypothetical protein ON010_g16572 [Phytophthora cinnamomi]|nr:hypothetical protein ON010_g16572 [Phytophthora cinnamomi]
MTSPTNNYYYLRPGTFDVLGFAYGKAEGLASRRGKVEVALVQSGRWVDQAVQSVELSLTEISDREVSEAEALQGPGTYVGSAVCTTRIPTGSARVWTYGLVVGYSWQTLPGTGFVDINFGDSVETVPYSVGAFHDLAVEIYALSPCSLRGTSELMSGEVKLIHQKIYDKFNGIGQSPVREVCDLVLGPRITVADETVVVPIFDVASSELYQVSVKHILDQVFYNDGGRNPPPGVTLRDSIFTNTNESSSAEPTTEIVLSDGLSDSEDDDKLPSSTAAQAVDAATTDPPRKHRRICTTTNSPGSLPRLQEPKQHFIGKEECYAATATTRGHGR